MLDVGVAAEGKGELGNYLMMPGGSWKFRNFDSDEAPRGRIFFENQHCALSTSPCMRAPAAAWRHKQYIAACTRPRQR